MSPEVRNLTENAVVYAVYHDGRLVHIGEGNSIARPAQYVDQERKKVAQRVTARYIEITSDVRTTLAMPSKLPETVRFHGNLERLLHAAYFWQHGALPEQDRVRGGNGTEPEATGGFVKSLDVVDRIFKVLDQLLAPNSRPRCWPTTSMVLAESIPPDPSMGVGRPATRERYLAFWVNSREDAAFIGHLPIISNNKQPQYDQAKKSITWQRPASPD